MRMPQLPRLKGANNSFRVSTTGSLGAVLLLATVTLVCANSEFRDRIPNGNNVIRNGVAWQGVGHVNQFGGGDLNPFGEDFKANGETWTRPLCIIDSDGDGVSNGEELGDPDCVWTTGSTPNRTTDVSHPGYNDSIPSFITTAAPATTNATDNTTTPTVDPNATTTNSSSENSTTAGGNETTTAAATTLPPETAAPPPLTGSPTLLRRSFGATVSGTEWVSVLATHRSTLFTAVKADLVAQIGLYASSITEAYISLDQLGTNPSGQLNVEFSVTASGAADALMADTAQFQQNLGIFFTTSQIYHVATGTSAQLTLVSLYATGTSAGTDIPSAAEAANEDGSCASTCQALIVVGVLVFIFVCLICCFVANSNNKKDDQSAGAKRRQSSRAYEQGNDQFTDMEAVPPPPGTGDEGPPVEANTTSQRQMAIEAEADLRRREVMQRAEYDKQQAAIEAQREKKKNRSAHAEDTEMSNVSAAPGIKSQRSLVAEAEADLAYRHTMTEGQRAYEKEQQDRARQQALAERGRRAAPDADEHEV